ncbi:hypothetical protein E2C01_074801 [Portunus trituberculatus]|uniref:Uncharacterized protein n=1 Tax=Portunus trituberculatus TaxID=210409 RepID=A0A5B7IF79_PORTR|nr:hypothetical protein [Portunus trituberculatus]
MYRNKAFEITAYRSRSKKPTYSRGHRRQLIEKQEALHFPAYIIVFALQSDVCDFDFGFSVDGSIITTPKPRPYDLRVAPP